VGLVKNSGYACRLMMPDHIRRKQDNLRQLGRLTDLLSISDASTSPTRAFRW
jgi:hypothetical protein